MDDTIGVVVLKPGREKPVVRRHPWIYSGAIAKVHGKLEAGGTVKVRSSKGEFLAIGAYSPKSQIRVRVWQWGSSNFEPEFFFNERISAALDYRKSLSEQFDPKDTTRRLVNAESDGLPGLVVDQYNRTLVVQLLSAGPEFWRKLIVEKLVHFTGVEEIYERSDTDVRHLEDLPHRVGPLRGTPPSRVIVREGGLKYEVGIHTGQKTGFYLDQRVNRMHVRGLAKGKDVLDCFCYTGGFSANAVKGGAIRVTSVDSSSSVLENLRVNFDLNNLPRNKLDCIQSDVFQQLRLFRDQGRDFDMIILDPPKFAPTVSYIRKAARGYKDINLLALKLLRPGGILATFSCSGGLDATLFQKIVSDAALDAGVQVRLMARLSQSPDHPVAMNFPEGSYLKGLVLYVVRAS
jgi:23S rRNA (cytosine1962-C5)-methyltransferase